MEFSQSGRESRFAAFERRGLDAIKSDLASTDRRAIGGPAAVSLAWEWVVMKEGAEPKGAKARDVRSKNETRELAAGDRRFWIATVDWKAAWRRLWSA